MSAVSPSPCFAGAFDAQEGQETNDHHDDEAHHPYRRIARSGPSVYPVPIVIVGVTFRFLEEVISPHQPGEGLGDGEKNGCDHPDPRSRRKIWNGVTRRRCRGAEGVRLVWMRHDSLDSCRGDDKSGITVATIARRRNHRATAHELRLAARSCVKIASFRRGKPIA